MGKRPFYVIDIYYEYDDGGDRGSKVKCILHKRADAISRFYFLANRIAEDFRNDDGELPEHNITLVDIKSQPLRGDCYFSNDNGNYDYINIRLREFKTDAFDSAGEETVYQTVLLRHNGIIPRIIE